MGISSSENKLFTAHPFLKSIKAKMKAFGALVLAGFLALAVSAPAEGEKKKGRKDNGCLCIRMKLDTDKDGVISADELAAKLETIKSGKRKRIVAQALFNALDSGDGVDRDAIKNFLESDPGCDKKAMVAIYKAFKRSTMDSDDNGTVDQAEADAYIADEVAAGLAKYASEMFKLLHDEEEEDEEDEDDEEGGEDEEDGEEDEDDGEDGEDEDEEGGEDEEDGEEDEDDGEDGEDEDEEEDGEDTEN